MNTDDQHSGNDSELAELASSRNDHASSMAMPVNFDVSLKPIEHRSAALAYIAQLPSLQSQETVSRVLSRIARLFCGITQTNVEEGLLTTNSRKVAIERNRYLLLEYPWGRMTKDLVITTLNQFAQRNSISPNTFRLYLSCIKGVARIALEKKQMDVENCQLIQSIKSARGTRKAKGRILQSNEKLDVIRVCKQDRRAIGLRDTAILLLLLSTGIRRSELVAIKVDDVDWVDRHILIHGKGNKERRVWLNMDTFAALKQWVDLVRGDYSGPLFCRIRVGDDVQVSSQGLNPQSVNYILEQRRSQSGIPSLKPHNLRRTMATDMENEGYSIRIIQQILGHSDVATTERYLYSGDEKVKDAMLKRKSV